MFSNFQEEEAHLTKELQCVATKEEFELIQPKLSQALAQPNLTFNIGILNVRNQGNETSFKVFIHYRSNPKFKKILIFLRNTGPSKSSQSRGASKYMRVSDQLIELEITPIPSKKRISIVILSSKSPIFQKSDKVINEELEDFDKVPYPTESEFKKHIYFMPNLGFSINSAEILPYMNPDTIFEMLITLWKKLIETNFKMYDLKLSNTLGMLNQYSKLTFSFIDWRCFGYTNGYLTKTQEVSLTYRHILPISFPFENFRLALNVTQILRMIYFLSNKYKSLSSTERILILLRFSEHLDSQMPTLLLPLKESAEIFCFEFKKALIIVQHGVEEAKQEYFWESAADRPLIGSLEDGYGQEADDVESFS